eukprot:SAG11_NODE_34791_length_270_cov_0.602339_1_plen_73_part_10
MATHLALRVSGAAAVNAALQQAKCSERIARTRGGWSWRGWAALRRGQDLEMSQGERRRHRALEHPPAADTPTT